MTDELTPEEKAALESLPRERMPAGLEARVVDAMRDHGFLAKRRRTIELTNGRMAGVLAAGVALMIGAYSIGLHRSDGGPMLPPTGTLQRDEGRLTETPTEMPVPEPAVVGKASEGESLAKEDTEKKRVQESKPDERAATTPPSARSDEVTEKAKLDWKLGSSLEEAPAPAQDALSAQGKLNEPSARALRAPAAASLAVPKRPLTFFLNGSPVIVEAPDSVRVIQDERGRMLIIYTSDGIIRIHLADEP
jgi:hypothetical protein